MQDRFKFRVWHKKRKKMYEVLHLHVGTYENGGDWATAKGFNIITQQDIHIQVQPKDCMLMQSTGLKDKNGKLIYEGDIVKAVSHNPNDTHIGLIQYHTCYFSLDYKNIGKYGEAGMSLSKDTPDYVELKIIGNIYENKDLLKEF